MNTSGAFSINEYDLFNTWGAFVPQGKGFYSALFKAPERQFLHARSWPGENGTRRIFTGLTYAPREMDLPFVIESDNTDDLILKYDAFRKFIREQSEFNLICTEVNRLFKLKYTGMPEFKNLTPWYEDDRVLVEFKIGAVDLYPRNFWDAAGDDIALIFPADIPDAPMDFDAYSFEIVGKRLIMTGPGIGGDGMKFNGNPISDYGLIAKEGCGAELLKAATPKGEIDGVFHTRELALPFILEANSVGDFLTKYFALLGYMLDTRYLTVDAFFIKKRFRLVYVSMSSLDEKGLVSLGDQIVFELVLTCYDDEPASEGNLTTFNGKFSFTDNGHLKYTQSAEFADQIDFRISEEGNLILIRKSG